MKRNIFGILIPLVCLLSGFNASAQNATGRPVWVVAHASNSHLCLMNAVRDGASGVEIDVQSDTKHIDTDWSVNHGDKTEHYLDPTEREKRNEIENRTGNRRYVSLKEYLNFEEMDKINILWLDVKTDNPNILSGGSGEHLMRHVHEILNERYLSKGKSVPFSIIYGIYNIKDFLGSHKIMDISSMLWENEGICLAYEGKKYGPWQSGSFESIETWMKQSNLKIEQHFMTCGFGPGWQVKYNSIEPECIRQARAKMLNDQYCSRVGFWTCTEDNHGRQLVCAKNDFDGPNGSYETECDLILMECDTEFFPLKLPGFSRWAVQNFINKFFKEDGKWYRENNRGHYRLATKDDKFYIKYSDPRRVK